MVVGDGQRGEGSTYDVSGDRDDHAGNGDGLAREQAANDTAGNNPHGVQGDDELASDLRPVEVSSKQPNHLQLAFA